MNLENYFPVYSSIHNIKLTFIFGHRPIGRKVRLSDTLTKGRRCHRHYLIDPSTSSTRLDGGGEGEGLRGVRCPKVPSKLGRIGSERVPKVLFRVLNESGPIVGGFDKGLWVQAFCPQPGVHERSSEGK